MNPDLGSLPLEHYGTVILVSLAISAALTPMVRRLALWADIVDHPSSEIKTHKKPTPCAGGIALWIAFASALILLRLTTHFPTGTLRNLRGILFGSTLIFFLGLLDDLQRPHGLGFKPKLAVQALAALLVIYFDIRIQFIQPDYLGWILSILWIVGITNALNIIDIMDGLCASQAVIAGAAFLLIALPSEFIYVNFAAAALVGAALGFLPYNLSEKKKIFLGDSGSLFLGFVLASLSLGTSYSMVNPLGVYAPLFILGVPLYDTLLVMTLRMMSKKSPFIGSKDHFALRLEAMGLSRRQILWAVSGASVLLSLCAFAVTKVSLFWALWIYFIVGGEILLLSVSLAKVKV